MKYLLFCIAIAGIAALGACNRTTTTEPSPVAAIVEDVDLHSLPATVDAATLAAIQEQDDVLVLDVREQWEYDEAHIPGVTHIPMNEVPDRLSEISTDQTVIVTCRSGNRSGQVTQFLRQNGYQRVHNLQGGILGWQEAGYAVE